MTFPLVLAVLAVSVSTGFIMPMTKTDGSPGLSSITNHVTLLEQMVVDLRTELKTTATQTTVLNTKLEDQEKASTAELKSVTDELVAVKKELDLTTSELIIVKDELSSLKENIKQNPAPVNSTVLGMISSDVKTNTREISALKSDVQAAFGDIGESKMNTSMLKTELRNMILDYNNSEQALRLLQASLTSEINDTKQDIEKLNMKQAESTAMFDHLQEKIFRGESALNKTEANIGFLEARIQSDISALQISTNISIAQLKSHVKYEVQQQKNLVTVEGVDTLMFDTVKANDGDGYNPSTGKFTAPVSGTFLFWANILSCDANTHIDFEMFMNGVVVARGSSHPAQATFDTVVFTYNTDMKAGDQVWYAKRGFDAGKCVHGYLYSSYGGDML